MICDLCHGTGTYRAGAICPRCSGTGKVKPMYQPRRIHARRTPSVFDWLVVQLLLVVLTGIRIKRAALAWILGTASIAPGAIVVRDPAVDVPAADHSAAVRARLAGVDELTVDDYALWSQRSR